MINLKQAISNTYLNSTSIEDFFSKIHNLRENDELTIIATGPTVNQYTEEQIINFVKDKDLFTN